MSDMDGQMSIMHIEYQSIGDGTKVTIKYELENVKGFMGQVTEIVNIQELMAKLIDHEIVSIGKPILTRHWTLIPCCQRQSWRVLQFIF